MPVWYQTPDKHGGLHSLASRLRHEPDLLTAEHVQLEGTQTRVTTAVLGHMLTRLNMPANRSTAHEIKDEIQELLLQLI
jgi:hypothetical protein